MVETSIPLARPYSVCYSWSNESGCPSWCDWVESFAYSWIHVLNEVKV